MIVGGRECVPGFDWSIYQPVRDHTGDGQSFAVIKATEGNGYHDPKYLAHVASLEAAGLVHGAYHFAQPSGFGYSDGRAEAQSFLAAIASTERFAVLDLEATSLDAHETAEFVRGWLDVVMIDPRFTRREQRVVYVGKWFNYEHIAVIGQDAVLWIPWYTAGYTPDVDPSQILLPGWSVDLWPEGWSIWQYSSSGTVAGVHPSDVNVATKQWFDSISGGPVNTPDPFPTPARSDMALPIFETTAGDQYFAVDSDSAPQGVGWRHILDVNSLAIAGKINPADYRPIGVGAGKPGGRSDPDPNAVDVFDAAWNAFPVLDGPDKRS